MLGAGVLVTTALAALTTGADASAPTSAPRCRSPPSLLAALANVGLFLLAFRVLTAARCRRATCCVGAVVAGVGWQIVQVIGTYFVTHMLRGRV